MKRAMLFVAGMVVAGIAGGGWMAARARARHAAEMAALHAAWQAERAELERALDGARVPGRVVVAPASSPPAVTVEPSKATPAELVARLRALRFAPGPGQAAAVRQAIHDFEELIAAGPEALPAIREFLARNEEVDFTGAGPGKIGRGGVPEDFVAPPSLRFGMFDAVKRIGGAEAEQLLAETLGTTGRGVEVAWLARALQGMAPDKYREAALTAARELLARPLAGAGSPLDQFDREHLFGVLAMFRDTSYVSTARGQLVQADGAVDRSALKYLQQTLGPQAVSIVAQAYQNPLLLTNAAAKEPLARMALSYVGADAQANEFYQQAINDPALTQKHRKNLIEDLNEDGFPDRKNLSPRDLPLIENRLSLIEQLAPANTDPVNAAAFKEAYKDLVNMRERITRQPGAVQ